MNWLARKLEIEIKRGVKHLINIILPFLILVLGAVSCSDDVPGTKKY